MLAVSVTIKERYICSINSYCDNNGEGIYAVLTWIMTRMTKTGSTICSVSSDCDDNDNNGEVYM